MTTTIKNILTSSLYHLGWWLHHARRIANICESTYLSRNNINNIKSKGIGIRLNGRGTFSGHNKAEIGNNVHIGDGYFIRGEGGLVIKENTHISRNVIIYTINHEYEGHRLPYDETSRKRPVYIGRNVWIGARVTILPGTKIHEGAIIGAGAVVAGEIPPMTIHGAHKAVKIGQRDASHYEALDSARLYGGVNGSKIEGHQS